MLKDFCSCYSLLHNYSLFRFILDYAAKNGGVVITRDNYRDLIRVSTSTASQCFGSVYGFRDLLDPDKETGI